MSSIRTLFGVATLATGLLCTSIANAQLTLRYAVGFPSGAGPESARIYAEAVKQYTNNTVNLRVFDLSLLNLAEMSAGVKQGIADIGYVLPPYVPAEYPYLNMAIELSMLTALEDDPDGKAGMAFAGALSEFIFTQCPECNADFARQNQVLTGVSASSTYMLLCTKPIRTVDDVKGARLRAGGAAWARWARQMGASPVSMPGNEIFEAMKQKVVECSIQSPPELSGLNLKEVTTDITPEVPGGIFAGTPANMNRDVWRKLNADQRRAMLRAGTVLTAQLTYRYYSYAKRDVEEVVARGAKIHQADAQLIALSRTVVEADAANLAATYAKQYGVKNGDALSAAMRPLVRKWFALVAPIENPEALADLYWNEVYSKIDVSTHGM